jgi:hypothetical protein
MDFTFKNYVDVLEAIKKSNYRTCTVLEYLKMNNEDNLIIIRHDVDSKPNRALLMAIIEEKYGVKATYYFRTISQVFDEEIISEIHNKGHEIGYHYEALDIAKGNMHNALDIFKNDLIKLNKICTIKTICMHGNSLTKWDNRDLWKFHDFSAFNILGEAYLSIDFEKLIYISDSSRSWKKKYKSKDIYPNMNMLEIENSENLINIIENNLYNKIYLLIHPDQWSNKRSEVLIDFTYYLFANIGKLAYKEFKKLF